MGFLSVEEIENITVEIEYFNHWNATASSQGKNISWSGFGKNEKSILGVIGENGNIEVRVRKDATSYTMFVKVLMGDKVLQQRATSEPNGEVVMNVTIPRDK